MRKNSILAVHLAYPVQDPCVVQRILSQSSVGATSLDELGRGTCIFVLPFPMLLIAASPELANELETTYP
jgi:hypothetical protein